MVKVNSKLDQLRQMTKVFRNIPTQNLQVRIIWEKSNHIIS